MPLSSVLGASTLIKPGVVTSSTRPSVPYEGQLIYETDTDRIAAYNGAAWVTQNGLQLVASSSFSGQTSVSLPANTFTSTYRNYRLYFQITSSTSDADITMRLRSSGSDISTSSYDNVWSVLANTGGSSTVTSFTQTSWALGEIDSANPWHYIALDIISPQVAANTFITGQYGFVDKIGSNYITRTGSGVFRLTSSVDALTVISSVASSITGVYRVYGYADN